MITIKKVSSQELTDWFTENVDKVLIDTFPLIHLTLFYKDTFLLLDGTDSEVGFAFTTYKQPLGENTHSTTARKLFLNYGIAEQNRRKGIMSYILKHQIESFSCGDSLYTLVSKNNLASLELMRKLKFPQVSLEKDCYLFKL